LFQTDLRRRVKTGVRSLLVFLVSLLLPTIAQSQDLAYVETHQLLQSDPGASDNYGEFLAMDGDTLVVFGDDFVTPSLYILDRNQGGSNQWGEVAKISSPRGSADQRFADFFDIQGDTIVVVGELAESGWAGIHVLERAGGAWDFVALVEKPERISIADVGLAQPSLSGDTLLVGSPSDGEFGFYSGAAYTFERDPRTGEWEVDQRLLGSEVDALDEFGDAVAIDGNTAVIGAPGDEEFGDHSGAAYVFERNEGTGLWEEVKRLVVDDGGSSSDEFGERVAIEGDVIVVGAPEYNNEGIGNTGGVFVFERDHGGIGTWGQSARLIPADNNLGDQVGESVSMHDGVVVAGAPGKESETGSSVGAVYLFERGLDGLWTESLKLSAAKGEALDSFGDASLAHNGTVVIGAPNRSKGFLAAGAAYVFQRIAAPSITISGDCPGGLTVSVSGATPSGSIALVGSSEVGSTIVPGGPCAGIELELENGKLLTGFLTDSTGAKSFQRSISGGFCGFSLQAVDYVTCGAGEVLQLP